jgi:hypothetical protein
MEGGSDHRDNIVDVSRLLKAVCSCGAITILVVTHEKVLDFGFGRKGKAVLPRAPEHTGRGGSCISPCLWQMIALFFFISFLFIHYFLFLVLPGLCK